MQDKVCAKDLPKGTVAWLYVRHSPGDDQTLESQEAALTKFCLDRGWVVNRVFRDRAKSGRTTAERGGFNQMIYLARQKPRPADALVIWDYSRFGRNELHSQFHKAELRMNGWVVVSMNDDVPDGDLGPIIEALIDWKNQRFLDDLRSSTMRGLRFIAEQGCLAVGQPCKGYMLDTVPLGSSYRDGTPRTGRKPVLNPDVAPLVVKAFELKAAGAPNEAIAKATGLYGPRAGSWNHFFRNRAYVGEYEFHGEVFRNVYPSLVSQELFDAVQKRLPNLRRRGNRRDHPRRKGSSFFLADVAACARCGSPMEGKRVGRYRYYVCSQHNEGAYHCPDSELIPADEIEERILGLLLDHILSPQYLEELHAWTNQVLGSGMEELRMRIEAKENELKDAVDLALKMARNFGILDRPSKSAELALHGQETVVERLRAELLALELEGSHCRIEATRDQIEGFVRQARALIDGAEYFDLRELCSQLASRIVLSPGECRLELHFPAK